jgi:hypothetical protein
MAGWQYLQAVLSRAGVDSYRWIREHAVIEFLIIALSFPMAFLVQFLIQAGELVRQVSLSIAVSLAALIALIVAVFVINLLMAPFRLAREGAAEAVRRQSADQQKISALERAVTALEERHPSIQVEVVNDRLGRMLLEVTNLGEHGEFEAQIEMLEGHGCIHGMERPTLPRYTGCWELGLGPKASLAQGHSDRLMIGKLEIQAALWTGEFHMYFYDARAGAAKHFGTTSWLLVGKGTVAARFVLRITISSTPGTKEGPFVKTYVVDGRGDPYLQEVSA